MVWARLDDNRHDEPDILALGDDIYPLACVACDLINAAPNLAREYVP